MKILLAISFGIAVIVVAPSMAHGQPRCGQYSLNYIVRDERGKVLDANAEGLWIGGGWNVRDEDLKRYNVPPAISETVGTRNFLAYIKLYDPCRFSEPIKLQLTLRGKNMNLIFHAEGQANIAVDSLPFQPGTFEHQMSQLEPNSRFYSVQGWKKISDQAEAVARYPIAFVRGRVVDSVTGKPVADARVSLSPNGFDSLAASNADPKGSYELRVRADRFEKVAGLAVIASHPDYLEDFAIAVKNRKGGVLATIDKVDVKLVRAVTVSGRIIDQKTGAAEPKSEEFTLHFEFAGRELWGHKVGGETEYTPVQRDGTFVMKTSAGKNKISFGGSFRFQLAEDSRELDVGTNGLSNVVLKLVPF